MSVTVKHLNADASFLLIFEPTPIQPLIAAAKRSPHAFTVVLDPWLSGSSKIWHSKFSISTHTNPSYISSLAELDPPNLVIISQDKEDHCHEATLKTLAPCDTKTMILAEPASAKIIRSWKYFSPSKVATLPKWDMSNAHRGPKSAIQRIFLPPLDPQGSPGEVTVAFIPQKGDLTRLHSAVGITYRPPTSSNFLGSALQPLPLTSPNELPMRTLHLPRNKNTVSLIFSPHGCNYTSLLPYVTSHLVTEGALPLTALLHCFDEISNPWYMGGNICAGLRGGAEIAQNLMARYWISAHDGDKDTSGIGIIKLRTKKFGKDEVEEAIKPTESTFEGEKKRAGPEVVVLGIGEEICF